MEHSEALTPVQLSAAVVELTRTIQDLVELEKKRVAAIQAQDVEILSLKNVIDGLAADLVGAGEREILQENRLNELRELVNASATTIEQYTTRTQELERRMNEHITRVGAGAHSPL